MNKSKEEVKRNLEEIGYFKYADSNALDSVIEQTFEKYKGDGVISFPWEGGLNRLFSIDAEDIYEEDGIKSLVEFMLPFFQSIGIELLIGKYVEEFDNNSETYTKRTIELNSKVYDASGTFDWATAFNSGFHLVNQILSDFNKVDKVYGLFMDECSTMIILEEPQFEYLCELIPVGSDYRPIDIKKMIEEHFG